MLPKILDQQNNPKSQTTSANPTMNFATALEDILGQQLRLTRYRPNSNARPLRTNIKVRSMLLFSLARIQHIQFYSQVAIFEYPLGNTHSKSTQYLPLSFPFYQFLKVQRENRHRNSKQPGE